MAGVNEILPTLQERGYEAIGICPDLPAGLNKTHMNKGLNFPLFSDSTVELSENFGIAFHMEDELVAMYLEKFKIDIEADSGESHHNLPVPSVFVIDASGTVKFVYTNPDHTVRLSNEELLAVAT